MNQLWAVVRCLQEEILKALSLQEEEKLERALDEVLREIERLAAEGGH